ncbi:MAG: hypothetical protein H6582_09245 [Crocinitomicaceae bacterium]|nr:hypothetical protein [Crocinitomicaceae bacterium]
MKLKTFYFFILLCINHFGLAQNDSIEFKTYEPTLKKNSIFASPGTSLFYGEVGLFYERHFFESRGFSFGLQAGAGYFFVTGESSGTAFNGHTVLLFGKKDNKFEVLLGGNYFLWDYFYYPIELTPSIALGYRFQKWTGFLFRTGIAYPKGLYLGIGWSF